MRRDGALLTLDDRRRLGSVGDGRMLVAEISVKLGSILPGDEEITSEAPSGDKESPSGEDGSPSGTEGRRKNAIASGTEGRRGGSGMVGRLIGKFRIDGSCSVSSDSNSNVETILSASTFRSRLEVTSDVQTSASNSPSE